jgi:hypothetical protein
LFKKVTQADRLFVCTDPGLSFARHSIILHIIQKTRFISGMDISASIMCEYEITDAVSGAQSYLTAKTGPRIAAGIELMKIKIFL